MPNPPTLFFFHTLMSWNKWLRSLENKKTLKMLALGMWYHVFVELFNNALVDAYSNGHGPSGFKAKKSCWTISKESIHQIQRLVRNYIWSGKEDQVTRAKVAWPILTSPKSRGGLGLFDPLTVKSLTCQICSARTPTRKWLLENATTATFRLL